MSRRRPKKKNQTNWGLKPRQDPWHVGDSWKQWGSKNNRAIKYGIDETGKCKYDASGRLKLKYPRYCQQGARMSFDIKNNKKKNTNENDMYRQYAALSSFGRKYSAKERLRGEGLQKSDFERYTQQKRKYLPSSTRTLQSYRFRTGERKPLKSKIRIIDNTYPSYSYDDFASYSDDEKNEEKSQPVSTQTEKKLTELEKKDWKIFIDGQSNNEIKKSLGDAYDRKKYGHVNRGYYLMDDNSGKPQKDSFRSVYISIHHYKPFNKRDKDAKSETSTKISDMEKGHVLEKDAKFTWELKEFMSTGITGNEVKFARGYGRQMFCNWLIDKVKNKKGKKGKNIPVLNDKSVFWVKAQKFDTFNYKKTYNLDTLINTYKSMGFEFMGKYKTQGDEMGALMKGVVKNLIDKCKFQNVRFQQKRKQKARLSKRRSTKRHRSKTRKSQRRQSRRRKR